MQTDTDLYTMEVSYSEIVFMFGSALFIGFY